MLRASRFLSPPQPLPFPTALPSLPHLTSISSPLTSLRSLSCSPLSSHVTCLFLTSFLPAGAYLTCSESLGWLCLSCDVATIRPATSILATNASACTSAAELRVLPRDAFRRRVYLQPLGLLLVVDGASIASVLLTLKPSPITAVVQLTPSPSSSTHAMLTMSAGGGRRVEWVRAWRGCVR